MRLSLIYDAERSSRCRIAVCIAPRSQLAQIGLVCDIPVYRLEGALFLRFLSKGLRYNFLRDRGGANYCIQNEHGSHRVRVHIYMGLGFRLERR